MSNPTFRSGPITFSAADEISKFRLVQVVEDGVKHADASSAVFGAVAQNASPENSGAENSFVPGNPHLVAVNIGPATMPVEVDGDAQSIQQGSPLYAAADGKVAASGSTLVGFAARPGKSKTVETTLVVPVAGGGAGDAGDAV